MDKFRNTSTIIVTIAFYVAVSIAPAWASLPYYNEELGYIIWLPKEWHEASDDMLSDFREFDDGLAAHMVGWEAGYVLNGNNTVRLLVSELSGKANSKAFISNFNRHVIRQVKKAGEQHVTSRGEPLVRLREASYDGSKKMLRLEMDRRDSSGSEMVSVVYIVYAKEGRLKFVGLVEPGDKDGVVAIDKVVSTLYLER